MSRATGRRAYHCAALLLCLEVLFYPLPSAAQQVQPSSPYPQQVQPWSPYPQQVQPGTPGAQQTKPGVPSTQQVVPWSPYPQPLQPGTPPPSMDQPETPDTQQAEPEPSSAQPVQPWSPYPPQAQPGAPSTQEPESEKGATAPLQVPEWTGPPLFREFLPPDFSTAPPIGTLEPLRPNRFAPTDQLGTLPDFRIQTFVTVSEAYNDNVLQTKDNRIGEFQTNVSPGITFNYNRPQGSLNFTYNPSFYFPSNKQVDNNKVNEYLSLRGAWNPTSRLQFNVAEDLTISNQSQDLQNPGTAFTGTGSYTTNTAATTAAYVAPQFRTALTYTNQYTTEDKQPINNNMTNAGNLSAEITNQRTTLTGGYTVTRGDFLNAPSSSYWDQLGTGRVAYKLTPTITPIGIGSFEWHKQDEGDRFNYILGQARAGATFTLPSNQSFLTFQGGAVGYNPAQGGTKVRPSFLLAWTQQLPYASSITASFESTYQSNFSGVSPTGLSYVRSASLILALNYFKDVKANLGGAWNWQDYAQTTLAGGPAGTKQETWSVLAQIQYLISRSFTAALYYNLTDRTSGGPYLQNIVGISLTYNYDFR